MRLFSLIAALLLAYHRPLSARLRPETWFVPYAKLLERSLNDGQARNGWIAWTLAVMLPAILISVLGCWLDDISHLGGWLFTAFILYLMLDGRAFNASAEQIAASLHDFNIPQARQQLSAWNQDNTEAYGAGEISRVTIETSLIYAHHGLFAPIFWFVVAGPGGVMLYRLSGLLNEVWKHHAEPSNPAVSKAFRWLDWIPVRVTSICYAVVGDFEDAMYCWRTQAAEWMDQSQGIMLASGAGALGVILGSSLPRHGILESRPEIGMGDPADADTILSAVGLIWRVLVLLIVLVLLLTFANWLGH